MELSVAVMLIVLGVANVAMFVRSMPAEILVTKDAEVHEHQPQHSHSHDHASLTWLDRLFGGSSAYQYLRPFIIGVVHGLAGSAAVALLVLTTIRNARWAVAYLLVFGVGTIAGMMVITLSIASAFSMVGRGRKTVSRRLALASGLLSLGFGLFVAYQICFVNGLLTPHAQWTPH